MDCGYVLTPVAAQIAEKDDLGPLDDLPAKTSLAEAFGDSKLGDEAFWSKAGNGSQAFCQSSREAAVTVSVPRLRQCRERLPGHC